MSRRRSARGNSHHRDPEEDEEEEMSESDMENSSQRRRNPQTRKRISTRSSTLGPSASQPSTSRASQAALSSQPSTSRASQAFSASQPLTSRATRASTNSHRDDPYELSQGSQRVGAGKLSEEDENNLVGSVIKYLLVADRSKTLIQRTHIVKAALPDHSRHYKNIMSKVQLTLREVFGYNLVELENNKYILTNNLDNYGPHLNFSKSEKSEMVILFIALAHIFMSDEGGCKEEDLFDLFRRLEIIEDNDFKNDHFGDVKYLLTDKFTKQGYLDLVTTEKTDPPIQHYQWGPRAENELTPRHILEFMSKIFGGRPLNTWPVQFKIMQTREDLIRLQ